MIKLSYSVLKCLVQRPTNHGPVMTYRNVVAYHKLLCLRNRHRNLLDHGQCRSMSDDSIPDDEGKIISLNVEAKSSTDSKISVTEETLFSREGTKSSSGGTSSSTHGETLSTEGTLKERMTSIADNEIEEMDKDYLHLENEGMDSNDSETVVVDIDDGDETLHKASKPKNTKSRHSKASHVQSPKKFDMKIIDPQTGVNVYDFLDEQKMKYERGHTCIIVNCLKERAQKKLTPGEAVYINTTTGYFTCFACKKHGMLAALLENWKKLLKGPKSKFTCFDKDYLTNVYDSTHADKAVTKALSKALSIRRSVKEEYTAIQNMFGFEKITKTVMMEHKVSFDADSKCLYIPYRGPDQSILDCKCLTAQYEADEVISVTHSFLGSEWRSLFGWREEDVDKRNLILTKTEKDAMTAQQVLKDYCVLSLPRETQLPQEALPYLERFEKIFIWFGCDQQSWETTKKIATKLGEGRCLVFRPGDACPTPHELLKNNLSLANAMGKAQPMQNNFLTSFQNIRDEVKAEITHYNLACGTKWKRFEMFNKYLKGFRPGELTVMSGRTGTGKTTFISEYSLDLCMQGVNTLWGSFEVNNVRLMKTMLTQFAMKNLTTHVDEFDYYADRFQELPMFFMTFFGQENINKVIDTMAHAVYIHDIQHVIVDNLQFMMGTDMAATDSFAKQNLVYSAFRRFASAHNCHITLVIHPRKEKEDTELTTSSIFGSAKATQEADNVMLLQSRSTHGRGKKYIQITKNRFDGEVGNITLKFDPESLTLSQTGKNVKKKGKSRKSSVEGYSQETSFSDEEEEEISIL